MEGGGWGGNQGGCERRIAFIMSKMAKKGKKQNKTNSSKFHQILLSSSPFSWQKFKVSSFNTF